MRILTGRPRQKPNIGNIQLLAKQIDTADTAKPNGTSIAFVIEFNGRRVLFTGDAHPGDIAAALKEDQLRQNSVRYRNAFGDTWDGKGGMPQWLQQATSAGQSLQHFAVVGSEKPAAQRRPVVDWSKDPFAGTRLATAPRS